LTGVDNGGIHRHFGWTGSQNQGAELDNYVSWHIKVSGYVVRPDDGRLDPVEGWIWLDRQWEVPAPPSESVIPSVDVAETYSPRLAPSVVSMAQENFESLASGWKWSGIHFRNRTDNHIYFGMWAEFFEYGTDFHFPNNVEWFRDDGQVVAYATVPVAIQVLDVWVSPVTGGIYPVKIAVTFTGLGTMTYTPIRRDQEFVLPTGDAVWEGLCDIQCDNPVVADAVGYLELVGYASLGLANN